MTVSLHGYYNEKAYIEIKQGPNHKVRVWNSNINIKEGPTGDWCKEKITYTQC